MQAPSSLRYIAFSAPRMRCDAIQRGSPVHDGCTGYFPGTNIFKYPIVANFRIYRPVAGESKKDLSFVGGVAVYAAWSREAINRTGISLCFDIPLALGLCCATRTEARIRRCRLGGIVPGRRRLVAAISSWRRDVAGAWVRVTVANKQSGERSEGTALFTSMTVECRMGAKIRQQAKAQGT
jgi:hypothetical protein